MFKAAAEALIESKRPGWRNAKHAAQWANTLETYAYPTLGELDVQAIDTQRRPGGAAADLEREARDREPGAPADRGRARLCHGAWARAPATTRPAGRAIWITSCRSRQGEQVEHHAALDWREAPAFMAELAEREGIAAKALAFAILTAARSGEVRGMTWAEVDDGRCVWTVPARPHQGRQGAPGAADARRAGAARRARRARSRWCSRARATRPSRSPT